jgi:CubicO group peptidase (beta-lactamase class C family)
MTGQRLSLRVALSLVVLFWSAGVHPQGTPTSVASLVSALAGVDTSVRRNAAAALGRLGSGGATAAPDLVGALDDRDAVVRWNSTVALAKIGSRATGPLLRALADARVNVRRGAALALGRMVPPPGDALRPLAAALGDRDAGVREAAARALGSFGTDAAAAVPALVGLFADEDPYVNGKAAEAAGLIGKVAVPALADALRDGRENVRWCAAIALGRIGPDARDAESGLVQALSDANANVRWCSVIALGNIGVHAKAAAPALVQCLSDRDEDVRWAASLALAQVDPEEARATPDWRSTAATIETLTPALMKELHVPGVSVALISGGALVWTKGYGVASVPDATPVTNGTLFEACSMTKPVFAYIVMKLVQEGRLDLDRPLAGYLDEASIPAQPERSLITARMVLSHTSGLPNWRKGGEEREGPLPVKSAPGSKFGYSGEGMFYLQRVVERITGEPLEVYAQRTFMEPMGLSRMSFVWTEELDPGIAAGHNADGGLLQKTRYMHANAAYSLYTSAEDYAKFIIAIMNPDSSSPASLSRRSLDAMLRHQVALDSRDPIERPGQARGSAVYWGLGWSINATGTGDIAHHSGANSSGFRCFSQFAPGRGSGIVIMTNGLSGGELWTRLVNRVGNL